MKKAWPLVILLGCSIGVAEAAPSPTCGPAKTQSIESRMRCTDDGGIAIGLSPEESSTFSCLESKTVQNRCGPDGSLTRLRAFQTWLKKVKQFETACTTSGGTFTYQDPQFKEPTDESFCSLATPEVNSNMFEDTLCNFQSACPTVQVRCEQTCGDPILAFAD